MTRAAARSPGGRAVPRGRRSPPGPPGARGRPGEGGSRRRSAGRPRGPPPPAGPSCGPFAPPTPWPPAGAPAGKRWTARLAPPASAHGVRTRAGRPPGRSPGGGTSRPPRYPPTAPPPAPERDTRQRLADDRVGINRARGLRHFHIDQHGKVLVGGRGRQQNPFVQRDVIELGAAGDQQPGAAAQRKFFPLYVGEAALLRGIRRARKFGIGAGRKFENGNGNLAVDVLEAWKTRARLEVV